MTDYKKYSLEQVENFLYDAMSTDATPQEIYDVIKGAVQDNYYTYKVQTEKAYELLALFNGNGGQLYEDVLKEREYYEPSMPPWGHSDLEYCIHNSPKKCDKDDPSLECKKSWNDFWEQSYLSGVTDTPEEAEELRAEIKNIRESGGFDWTPTQDKVKKWVLPVEPDPSGEYFVTFPDDLLEAANLNEGDSIEWISQDNGSYLMKKVEKKEQPSWVRGNELAKVKTYQEMIDDGWTMTDDGFWIKEN